MPFDDSFQFAGLRERKQLDKPLDLKKIFYLIFAKWYYFLFALVFALICAFLYNKYTIPVYKVSANILIDEERKGIQVGNNKVLEGFGLGTVPKNLDNQIMILSSRTLISRTLDELNFDIEYYRRGFFNEVSFYPDHAIKIVPEITDSLPQDVEFSFKYLDNNIFTLKAQSKDTFSLNEQATFGENINCPGGGFKIELESDNWFSKKKNWKFFFINHSRKKLVEDYKKQLKVQPISKNGTIVNLSLEGTNKTMNIDFLNKLTEIFLTNSLDKKNEEAVRIIQFIDDQLIGISDSLVIAENKLQQFRSRNRVMNLSAQGQAIIEQAMKLENDKARIEIEANYYSYLAEYLVKDNVGEVPIAPATIGITDPGLTRLVTDLADLQGQFYSKSLGVKNPLQSQLTQRIRNTKEALKETLSGVMRANNLARNEIAAQIRTVNAQATALPVTERQLLGIERKFKLNDELYTFLLEKRAEAQIQKASNMPDNEIIDTSEADVYPIKPKKLLIYLFATLLGLIVPFSLIIVVDNLSNKVKEEEDILKITDKPISGHIPHNMSKNSNVVFDEPNSPIAEAFRSLRYRMQFFTKEIKAPVILITSSLPEEGKTFTAVNLASVYSLMGKRTVLVGFDLRKPKMYQDFELDYECGVSTWLIGKHGLEDIIKETPHKNLFIIPAGPIPPNPAELISLDKTNELINLLKEKYDCIIIDSSPIGIVSDAFHLAALADTCTLIVRQNKALKNSLENTIKELEISAVKSISIVVNDIRTSNKSYGYGYK